MGLSALAWTLAAAVQTAAQAPPVPIAVTASGQRVELSAAAEAGDRQVATPFGEWMLAADPVVEVVDGAKQLEQLLVLHRSGALDDLGLAQDLATAGQLRALAEHAAAWAARDPQRVEPYLILESWGERLDPVPRETPRERRVEWLWDRATGDDWALAVLAAPRLRQEVSAAYQARSEVTVSISRLRKALRSRNPQHRRAAAFVAGKQQEFSLRAPLLLASLEDRSPAARDGAARAAGEVQPKAARDYWSRVLAVGEPARRAPAALGLGRHGGDEGLRMLIHVLACWDQRTGVRFEFAGREIFVVSNYDSNAHDLSGYDVNHLDPAFTTADPNREYLDLGSRLKVTRLDEALLAALLEALDAWAGERTGRDAAAWIRWYLEDPAAPRPRPAHERP
jgi:hypothetical protein